MDRNRPITAHWHDLLNLWLICMEVTWNKHGHVSVVIGCFQTARRKTMSKDGCQMMSKDSRYARNTESRCKWIQKVKEETVFTIGSGNLIPSTKAGWLHLKLTGKKPCANAVIDWSTFQTWESLHWNRTWKVKDPKTTAELEVNRLRHYPHSVLYHLEMEIQLKQYRACENGLLEYWLKVLEKSLNKRLSNLCEPWWCTIGSIDLMHNERALWPGSCSHEHI